MISYCTTVYNEKEYIKILLDKLTKVLQEDEEIVVIQTYRDISEQNENFYKEIKDIIDSYKNLTYHTYHFQDDFANLKNYMNSFATKSYIFNLDADEDYPETAFQTIRLLIKNNPQYDLFNISRINIVEDLTLSDIKKYGWFVNDNGWVNWPDFQPRLYKNNESIKWSGTVHENLSGATNRANLQPDPATAILHYKHIDRQRKQNDLYDKIQKKNKPPISISSCRALIGLCSWNNPDILKKCVKSIQANIDLSKDRIAVVLNEGDPESISFLSDLKIPFVYNPENSGPLAIDFLKPYIERSEYFVNSNDDMIYHNNFVDDLISIIDSNYPATASCGLVENFDSKNPCVIVDSSLVNFEDDTIRSFLENAKQGKYTRKNKVYGYSHPIMCKSSDLLSIGGYSGNWDTTFISGFVRDDLFPYILWIKSQQKYKFIISDKSTVFHLSSYTNNKLPSGYRETNCSNGNKKFKQLTGIEVTDFRKQIVKVGEAVV